MITRGGGAIEGKFPCYPRSPRNERQIMLWGPHREQQLGGRSRSRESGGNGGGGGFLGESKAGGVSCLRLAGLNNSTGPWGLAALPSVLRLALG